MVVFKFVCCFDRQQDWSKCGIYFWTAQSAFSMFLSFLDDGSDISNFTLKRNFERIFFVSSFWTSLKKMKTHSHKDQRPEESQKKAALYAGWCNSYDWVWVFGCGSSRLRRLGHVSIRLAASFKVLLQKWGILSKFREVKNTWHNIREDKFLRRGICLPKDCAKCALNCNIRIKAHLWWFGSLLRHSSQPNAMYNPVFLQIIIAPVTSLPLCELPLNQVCLTLY